MSAKRRRLNPDAQQTTPRPKLVAAPRDPYELADTPPPQGPGLRWKSQARQPQLQQAGQKRPSPPGAVHQAARQAAAETTAVSSSSATGAARQWHRSDELDELSPDAADAHRAGGRGAAAATAPPAVVHGARESSSPLVTSVRRSPALSLTAYRSRHMDSAGDELASSSPHRSARVGSKGSGRTAVTATAQFAERGTFLSPYSGGRQRVLASTPISAQRSRALLDVPVTPLRSVDGLGSAASAKMAAAASAPAAVLPSSSADEEHAEAVSDGEAARHLARRLQAKALSSHLATSAPFPAAPPQLLAKQRRESHQSARPTLGKSGMPNKRKRRRRKSLPAAAAAIQGSTADDLESSDLFDGLTDASGALAVSVQRFRRRSRPPNASQDSGDKEDNASFDAGDMLSTDIPFSALSGVNAIDVLAQVCRQVGQATLAGLRHDEAAAGASSAGRELRLQRRAVRLFLDELQSRLLEHTIALDTVTSLSKRLTSVQKQRLSLRRELLRIKADRDLLSIEHEAVRARHDQERAKAGHPLDMSAAMHDIQAVVDQARSAPELGSEQRRMAELANLPLRARRVADHISGSGFAVSIGSGSPAAVGMTNTSALAQIRSFNAFLERAAQALERRPG